MTKKEKEEERIEARTHLLKNITPETTLLIVIKSVSGSGMCRRMKVVIGTRDISYWIARLCDLSINNDGELKIIGCGMDMTFWLANQITYQLWPDNELRKKLPFKGNGGSCLDWNAI